ncbi:hypothetical protein GCM10025867_04960 [Frondihabitans sucicola]|uniref:Uncharacterized protein n=1 Tax=Frondihabitans sucicola TaxID=1268041 RepID=A0ABN6XX72_9MICO|nr:hypothetical protein GCM10025867_04960 [Frondihabitans sucicola]
MGVQGSGEAIAKILRRPIPSHPLAVPPVPGTYGTWQVRRHRSAPIGYVNMRSLNGRHVYDAYAHCRDDNGGRPWLRTFDTLNSAVAWIIQHEDQIQAYIDRHHPEPEQWPA